MKKLFEAYIQFIHQVNEFIGKNIAWLNVFLVLLICIDVFLRYAFKATTVAIIELEWHIFALIFMICMGYSLRYDRHVRVDVFYNQFSEKTRAWVNLLGGVFLLIPFCLVVIYTGFRFTGASYGFNEGSPNPGGLPARYLIKSAIPIGFTFLLLQCLAMIFSAYLVIIGQRKVLFDVNLDEEGKH